MQVPLDPAVDTTGGGGEELNASCSYTDDNSRIAPVPHPNVLVEGEEEVPLDPAVDTTGGGGERNAIASSCSYTDDHSRMVDENAVGDDVVTARFV